MSDRSGRRRLVRIDGDRRVERSDLVAVEEPLEIRVDGDSLSVTMRTPGNDFELIAGFLHAEGIIAARHHLRSMRYCGEGDAGDYNLVDVELAPDAPGVPGQGTRRFGITSACGVCGTASIDALRQRVPFDVAADPLTVHAGVLRTLPGRLRSEQRGFERTGGLHAAGLFDSAGRAVCVREDVGRHNALDKVIGWAVTRDRLPLRSMLVVVSGRASFELVQKAVMAGAPLLAAVSAPSSLAVDLAADAGLTLVGFLRGETMNLYARPNRVTGGERRGPGLD